MIQKKEHKQFPGETRFVDKKKQNTIIKAENQPSLVEEQKKRLKTN